MYKVDYGVKDIVQVDLMEYMEMEHTQQFNVLKKREKTSSGF